MKRSSYELEVHQRKKRKIFLLSTENWLSKWVFFAESAMRPHGLTSKWFHNSRLAQKWPINLNDTQIDIKLTYEYFSPLFHKFSAKFQLIWFQHQYLERVQRCYQGQDRRGRSQRRMRVPRRSQGKLFRNDFKTSNS